MQLSLEHSLPLYSFHYCLACPPYSLGHILSRLAEVVMSSGSGPAIIGAAAAARAHGSGGKKGLRALWSDKKTVYIAIFASLVSVITSAKLLPWSQIPSPSHPNIQVLTCLPFTGGLSVWLPTRSSWPGSGHDFVQEEISQHRR